MSKRAVPILLTIYIILLLVFTVFDRSTSISIPQVDLFWSYKEWLNGNWNIGKQILGNIIMFIPLGFLASSLRSRRARFTVIIFSIATSLLIETLQLVMHRGLFEFDDVLNNTIGGVIGGELYTVVNRFLPSHAWLLGVAAIGVAGVIVILTKNKIVPNFPQSICFQVSSIDSMTLSGFSFLYERDLESVSIKLKPRHGKPFKCQTSYGLLSPVVNQYFLCDHDYSRTGFSATLPENYDPDEEYEIVVSFGWMLDFGTGVYVTGDRVHYCPDAEFNAPEGLDEIIDNGTLRVYRPDYHCWVYQKDWCLYWIVDQDFNFEDDGSTYIQYQLWTTQTEKLPRHRLDNKWYWDNIGGNFEDYEIYGDFGSYRIMKRELPTEYSITSIVTGYYKDGKWIWKEYFRPIYEF